jgi:hypothetical protein
VKVRWRSERLMALQREYRETVLRAAPGGLPQMGATSVAMRNRLGQTSMLRGGLLTVAGSFLSPVRATESCANQYQSGAMQLPAWFARLGYRSNASGRLRLKVRIKATRATRRAPQRTR